MLWNARNFTFTQSVRNTKGMAFIILGKSKYSHSTDPLVGFILKVFQKHTVWFVSKDYRNQKKRGFVVSRELSDLLAVFI